MRLKYKCDRFAILELLIILLAVNYMIGTIILHDIALIKYLRDVIVICILFFLVSRDKIKLRKSLAYFFLLLPLVIIGVLRAPSLSIAFVVVRRYLFPIGVLLITTYMKYKVDMRRVGRFVLSFFSFLAGWGVFQAYILGDTFLRRLGYPVVYSYGYKRDMLYNSFYFGGFGIQRVVATFSSSNICGLAFGMAILFVIFMHPYMKFEKKEKCAFLMLILGYVLTVSRSNFVAMLIVGIFLVWPNIPKRVRRWIPALGVVAAITISIIGAAQGSSGIIYKLVAWVRASLNFSEDSAAGRSGIWRAAFQQVVKSPLGIGFGHVGGMADNLGVSDLRYSSENSYLAIALDMGAIATVIVVMIWLRFIHDFKKARRIAKVKGDGYKVRLFELSRVLISYFMIVAFFSNHIHDMEVVSFLYFYIGIAFKCMEGLSFSDTRIGRCRITAIRKEYTHELQN